MNNNNNTDRRSELSRWSSLIVTILICAGAFIVQWGSIKAQLSDISTEIGYLRTDTSSVKERVSFIEGKLNGQKQAHQTEGGQ